MHGFIELPSNEKPEDPHLGLSFDYEFSGKRMGEQVSLHIHSWIIDYQGKVFSRKGNYLLPRVDAVEAITKHIRNHLMDMGIDDMSCRRLLRDFEVEKEKSIPFDSWTFHKRTK